MPLQWPPALGAAPAACILCGPKDFWIPGIVHADIAHRDRMEAPSLRIDPTGEQRRELGIKPERHPTSTGWSISRTA